MKSNNIHKLILLLGLFFIVPNAVMSQVFKATAPKVVSVGERFQYVLSSSKSGKITQPEFRPAFADMATTQSYSSFITNGKVEQNFTFTTILQALQEGKFTIGEAILTDDEGNTYKTEPISIEVIKGQVPQQQHQQQQQQQQQGSTTNANDATTDVFMRFIPSRTSLYRGDNFTLTLKIYRGLNTALASLQDFNLPAFDGFWAKDITPNTTALSWQRENVDGKIYDVAVLKTWTLNPQKSGALRIGAASLVGIIQRRVGRRGFLFDDVEEIRKPIKTSPFTINVKDMPSGAPSSFNGAVGSFSMSASLSKNKVTANDAANLNIKISGSGNLSLITIPKVNLPLDFDTYDSKKTVSGNSITFEIPFIPRSAGTFTIDPVNFSYFEPSEGVYKTLTSNPMIIEVEKDVNSSQQETFPSTHQRDVQILASDIRFIKNNVQTWHSKGSRFLGMKQFYPAYIIAIVAFILLYLLFYKRNKNSQNVILMRNRKAKRIAKKRLNIAEKAMNKNNTSVFYDEILKAVWGYLGDKFSLPVAELSRNTVSELLTAKQVEQKYIDMLIGIVDECEFARYAPGVSSSQMRTIYNTTIEVMSKLEQKTK